MRERWEHTGPFESPARAEWPAALRRVHLVGVALFAVQFLVLCWWSSVLSHRYSLTKDFAAYQQGAYLIGHGHLNPYSSVFLQQLWRNNSEFLIWPMAIVVRLWPHLTALQWLQDLALVCTEFVALNWMCSLGAIRAKAGAAPGAVAAVVAAGIVMILGNPWTAWTASFDVHLEPFAAFFTLCAARNLYGDRTRRAWLWIILAIACGPSGASYIAGLGVSAILTGRHWWRRGAGVAGAGFIWVLLISVIGGASGTGIYEYGYLATHGSFHGPIPKHLTTGGIIKAVLMRPQRLLEALWYNRVNLWATISAGGVVGLFWLPLAVPALLIAAEVGLSIPLFSRPGFQTIALAPMVALGTVALVLRLTTDPGKRRRAMVAPVCLILALNAVVWSVVWLPQVSKTWLLVSPAATSTLESVSRQIQPGDEVYAVQGVLGGFSERKYAYILYPSTAKLSMKEKTVWIIIAPQQGIEAAQAHAFYSEIGALDNNPRVRKVAASNGIWAFKVTRARDQRLFEIGNPARTTAPAWTLTGSAGREVEVGPQKTWYATSTGQPGYVVSGAYFREGSGAYRLSMSLSVAGTANVELWNDDTQTLLKRVTVHNTGGVKKISADVRFKAPAPYEYPGWGIWRITPVIPDGDDLEVRVYNPGKSRINVYKLSLAGLRS